MKLITSTEAIAFQEASPLMSGLTEIFQSAIDLREKEIAAKRNPIKAVEVLFKKQLTQRFKRTIKDMTGLTITKITYADRPSCFFAVEMNIVNLRTTLTAKDRQNATAGDNDWIYETYLDDQKEMTADELIGVSETLNTTTGKLGKPPKLPKGSKISAALYMDYFTLILAHETMRPTIRRLSARQCAAIYIHEIGHQLSLMEHACEQYRVFEATSKMEDKFLHSAEPKERRRYMNHRASQLSTYAKSDAATDKVVTTLSNASAKLNVAGASQEATPAISIVEKTKYAITQFLMVSLMNTGFLMLVPFIVIFNVAKALAVRPGVTWDGKKSDIAPNSKDPSMIERRADEFASRHGAGGDIAAALNIIHSYAPFLTFNTYRGIKGFAGLRAATNEARSNKAAATLLSDMWPQDERFTVYETSRNRIKRLRENTAQIFSVSDLPPEFAAQYLEDFEEIERQLKAHDKAQSPWAKATFGNAMKLLDALSDGANLVDIISDGGFYRSYSSLVDAADALNKNALYARSQQLKRAAQH